MMTITFSIEYKTQWGEDLYLMLNNDPSGAVAMRYTPGDIWTTTLHVSSSTSRLRYRYMVKVGQEVTRVEQCSSHNLALPTGIDALHVEDAWDDDGGAASNGDFVAALVKQNQAQFSFKAAQGNIVFEASYPELPERYRLAVVGEAEALGAWNVRHAVEMARCDDGLWRLAIDLPAAQLPTAFKLVALAPGKRLDVMWEHGANRCLRHAPGRGEALMLPSLRFRSSTGRCRVASFVDLLALRSDRDMGSGDFGDLKKLIRWAASTGQNELTLDSLADPSVVKGWMPDEVRQRVIARAIDVACIDLSSLGSIADRDTRVLYQRRAMALNALEELDLDKVRQFKLDYCHAVLDQAGSTLTRTAAYRRFLQDNADWLRPYAAQAILCRLNSSADTTSWGIHSRYDTHQLEKFLKAHHRETTFIYTLQYRLRQQLIAAADCARTQRITLSCDMAPRHFRTLDPREPWVNERQLLQRLEQQGGTIIIPLRDWLLINGDFLPRLARSATRRLPITLEELTAATRFTAHLRESIQKRPEP